jgi:hypothetical protein
MSLRSRTLSLLTLLSIVPAARSQTVFTEVEPNGTKPEATAVNCMVAGDSLSGTTTGSTTTVGSTLITTADMFRVKTCTLPAGIYRHDLTLTTTAGIAPTATIRGLNQNTGVVGTIDSQFQASQAGVSTWYGFGRQEQIYYEVTGTGSTTGTYSATLTTTPITPTNIAGTFTPGTITIDFNNQGNSTDTEVWIYDSTLAPLPCAGDDDSPSGTLSRLTANLAAGVYYVAVSTYNMANNLPSPTAASGCSFVDNYTTGIVLDFPDAIADAEFYLAGGSLNFSVTDGTNTTIQPATKSTVCSIEWFRLTVGNPFPPPVAYCSGDGSGTACPCGNSGAAGNGCASSVSANGAHLAGSGAPSIASDTFVLNGTLMPSSSALYFQGTSQTAAGAGAAFGDGLRCASGSVVRLGTKTNVGGSSSYPTGADVHIGLKGMNAAGNVRDYQCWYRNAAAYCTPSTFNLTNGLEITWIP